MARTTPTGKLLTKAPSAKQSKMAKRPAVDADFAAEWNSLEKPERRQIRRLVRIGRPQETAEHARLAVAFAAYQRSRAWYRFFYLWIAPLVVAGVIAGLNLHPIIIGMVLGGLAMAYMSRRNYKRAEAINAGVITEGTTSASVVPAAA